MGILVFLKEEMGVGRGREEPLTSWVHPLKWGHFVKTGCFKLGVYWLVCDKINLFGCDHKKKNTIDHSSTGTLLYETHFGYTSLYMRGCFVRCISYCG